MVEHSGSCEGWYFLWLLHLIGRRAHSSSLSFTPPNNPPLGLHTAQQSQV